MYEVDYLLNTTSKDYNFAKRCLGFSHASLSTFKRSLKPFFDDIDKDKDLSNAHRDNPDMLYTDQSVHKCIRRITQKHGHWIWSDDPTTRNRVLVEAKGYKEYPKDLFWSKEEHRKIIHPDMIEVVVGYLILKRRRDKRRKGTKISTASVADVDSQDDDEGVDEGGDQNQDKNEDGADRVEESNQEDEANGENQDGRGTSSYQIGGRELLQ